MMKQDKPLVSIIISNFNGKDLLKCCLDSLMKLNYPQFEVIVVDAGSIDGAPVMVEKDFPSVKVIREKKIGIGEAINIGISQSAGEIIVFDLNNDDVVSPDWLTHLVDTLMSSPKIGIVGGRRYLGDTNKYYAGSRIIMGVFVPRKREKVDTETYNDRTEVETVGVIATRRDVLEKIGLLDEDYYIYGEDIDFCIRARKMGYQVVKVPEAVLWHRQGATIGQRTPLRLHYLARSRIRLISKHYPIYKKIPILALHFTIIPVLSILYHTYFYPGKFLKFVKAWIDAFLWNLNKVNRLR